MISFNEDMELEADLLSISSNFSALKTVSYFVLLKGLGTSASAIVPSYSNTLIMLFMVLITLWNNSAALITKFGFTPRASINDMYANKEWVAVAISNLPYGLPSTGVP